MSEADFVLAQVNDALLRSEGLAAAEDKTAPLDRDVTEASPWLELTRWPEYVGGHSFSSVAPLAALPDLTTEPLLAIVESSVGRLIGAAFESISSHLELHKPHHANRTKPHQKPRGAGLVRTFKNRTKPRFTNWCE